MNLEIQVLNTPKKSNNRLLLIYTGGTFGMVTDDDTLGVKPVNWNELKEYFPALKRINSSIDLVWLGDAMDSSDIRPEHWIKWSKLIEFQYNNYDGFIFIHGTDTMAFSSSAMSFFLQGIQKPVIFTGAQLPISATRSDARDNLLSSIELASMKNSSGKSYIQEVCIYFNNKLMRGNRCKKTQSAQFDAFESPNYGNLAETGINIIFNENLILQKEQKPVQTFEFYDSKIDILKLYPGFCNDETFEKLTNSKSKALILESYGSGNAPHSLELIDALNQKIDEGKIVFNISQCLQGEVQQSRYHTGKQLQEIGVISGGDITFEASVTKMMWALGNFDLLTAKKLMSESVCGEMS
ncbi:MAG: asparaginase [Cytophagales bacterium]